MKSHERQHGRHDRRLRNRRELGGKDTSERRPAHNAVAELAHYLYEVRGRQDGHDVEDWLRAEDLLAHGLAEARL